MPGIQYSSRRRAAAGSAGWFVAATWMTLNAVTTLADVPVLTHYPDDVTVTKGARAGDLELQPCRFRLEADGRDYPADCGTLVVPENRKKAGARLIALPVIRIRATGARPSEPIFTFNGGPGSPNLVRFASDGLLDRHDLVMVGYRGIDSSVKLRCPEIQDHAARVDGPLLAPRTLAGYAAGARECSDRLEREGVDLAGYSMTESVDDQELARRALGYGRINLLGRSFGTRLELIYMWRHPASLNRVVMIAINPPGGFVWDPRVTERRLARYGELCARDPHCSARTDDLVATMRQVSDRMPTSWMGIPIDADRVRFLSFMMLHESIDTGAAPVPMSGPVAIDMWLDAAEGDASGMALTSLLGHLMIPRMFKSWGHFLAMGASSMDFLDSGRDYDYELRLDHAIIGAPGSRFFLGLAPGWPPHPDRAEYGEALHSDVEALLVSGTLDFTTPFEPPARDELMSKLPNGHLVLLREFGHTLTFWNSQREARERLLNTFFDEGRVDDSLYVVQPPAFEVETGLDGSVRRLLTALAACTAVLALVLWLAIRAVRRRRRRVSNDEATVTAAAT